MNERSELLQRISVEPGKMGGKPCIRRMRIRVTDVLELLASEMTEDEILRGYPYLEPSDFKAALLYAADLVNTDCSSHFPTQRPISSESAHSSPAPQPSDIVERRLTDPRIISVLRDAMKRAEAGEFVAVAVVGVKKDGTWDRYTDHSSQTALIGGLNCLAYRIHDRVSVEFDNDPENDAV